MRQNLGLVPAWQFSGDPNVNPLLNRYASIPAGWASQSSPAQVAGIPTAGMTLTRAPVPPSQAVGVGVLGYPGVPGVNLGFTNPFESVLWAQRKKFIIGGVVVLGLAGVALVTSLLR